MPAPILRWQLDVHGDWAYDLELDTSVQSPAECAAAIAEQLRAASAPTAFARLRG